MVGETLGERVIRLAPLELCALAGRFFYAVFMIINRAGKLHPLKVVNNDTKCCPKTYNYLRV